MYVYVQSGRGLWTVGFYDPAGKWQAESDHGSPDEAARRVRYLNGGEVNDGPVAVGVVGRSACENVFGVEGDRFDQR